MKKFIMPLAMALVLTGCSTYQYSARTVGIERHPVSSKEIAAEIVPDYDRTVTATSDYQLTRNDAINEAGYRCIIDNDIDVIVDPIVKVERAPIQSHKKYRATISGFAGKYRKTAAGVDAVKEYDKEDIEKYKLLYDPDFARYYYGKGTGDSYYINSSAPTPRKEYTPAPLAFAPKIKRQQIREFDFGNSRKLRNAGIGLTVAGVVSTFALGVPLYISEGGAGSIVFMTIGPAAVASGIPMWCIGAKRMKSSDRDANVSIGGSQTGVGIHFNF